MFISHQTYTFFQSHTRHSVFSIYSISLLIIYIMHWYISTHYYFAKKCKFVTNRHFTFTHKTLQINIQ